MRLDKGTGWGDLKDWIIIVRYRQFQTRALDVGFRETSIARRNFTVGHARFYDLFFGYHGSSRCISTLFVALALALKIVIFILAA